VEKEEEEEEEGGEESGGGGGGGTHLREGRQGREEGGNHKKEI
jgi:hypothetical protein